MRLSALVGVLWAAVVLSVSGGAPELAKVNNVGALNTKADEVDPFVTATNRALTYASNVAGSFDIYVSYRSETAWGKGAPLPGYDDKEADERSPCIVNTTVYFATNSVPDEKLKDLKNFDLKFSTEGRSALPLLGISTKDDELHPWVRPSAAELYFSRKTAEGWMQYVATGSSPGSMGKARPVGLDANFHNATLTSDGRTMYIEGPLDDKRTRLFVTKREAAGAWSKPKMITNLSAAADEHSDGGPALSPDGKYLYFTSNRAGGAGGWDIYATAVSGLKIGQ